MSLWFSEECLSGLKEQSWKLSYPKGYREFESHLLRMRYLGIDYGSKKVGLAVSDKNGGVAFPLEVIPNTKKLLTQVSDICQQEKIIKIICGLSLDFSGQDNPIAKEAKSFCEQLAEKTGLPLDFENEVLTSVFASQTMVRDDRLDARAAALILQRYLDRLAK